MDVSIIIPSKNGINTIERCLRSIKSQRTKNNYEIILVDSGSSDGTINIAEKYGCKIIRILPQEFTHGYSRNLGADGATGKILIFLNQDAIPRDDMWMERLTSQINDINVAAFSRQVPYPTTHVIEKVFLNRIYSNVPRIINKKSLKGRRLQDFVLFSSVSAAIRKDIFLSFRFSEEIIMTEDQELAVRLIESGYTIKYIPESIVVHSHSYSPYEVFRRYFDSGQSVYSIPALREFNIRDVIAEEFSVLVESFQTSKSNPFECIFSLVYLVSKSVGFVLGTKAHLFPIPLRNRLSHTVRLTEK